MQFTILINQSRALEWSLNAQQAFLFAYLFGCPAWAETCNVDGDLYFRISKKKVCEDLPLLTDKPNTIHKIMKSLEASGLILMAVFDNETHISITEKGTYWNRVEGVEKNPTLGNNSMQGMEKNPDRGGKKSTEGVEKFPTNQSISNKIIKSNNYDQLNTSDVSQAQPAPQKSKRGTRLPEDWKPTIEYWDEAKLINPNLRDARLTQIAAEFRDYWISKSGAGATKTDWLATWRNWIRREKPVQGAPPSGPYLTAREKTAQRNAEIFDINRARDF